MAVLCKVDSYFAVRIRKWMFDDAILCVEKILYVIQDVTTVYTIYNDSILIDYREIYLCF